jgi:hypothetical protein
MNRPQTLADRINADVEFHGINRHGQFMAKNGSPLITDLFPTAEAMVARFGQRIKIDDRVLKHSTPYQNGLAAVTYSPREGADQQEVREYASGYLKRLLTRASPTAPQNVKEVVITPTPKGLDVQATPADTSDGDEFGDGL